VPGGGANAVHNLWALGARPVPVGIVGDDAEGNQLVEYFANLEIDVERNRVAKSYRTPRRCAFWRELFIRSASRSCVWTRAAPSRTTRRKCIPASTKN